MNRRVFIGSLGAGSLFLGIAPTLAAGSGDLAEVLALDAYLSTFLAAVTSAGLLDILKAPGPYTVFAPTNEAFARLPSGKLDSLLEPANRTTLAAVLSYHIVPRYLSHRSLIQKTQDFLTLQGQVIRTAGSMAVTANGTPVLQPELIASNGVIHPINGVLIPKI